MGLDKLYYSKITEDAKGYEAYGKPQELADPIKADLSVERSTGGLHSGDKLSYWVDVFKSGKVSLGVDEIGVKVAQDLTGATLDANGALVSAGEDMAPPVAIGFRALKPSGKYRYFWIYRVQFGPPSTNLQTKGESIAFQTPAIEGVIMRRNKPDGRGKHPWKTEMTEGDAGVGDAVIKGWYDEVYEPNYGGEPAEEPADK